MHTFNMMRKRLRFWFVTMMLALMSQSPLYVTAQNPQTIEVGPHFGVTSYVGELNTWRNLLDFGLSRLDRTPCPYRILLFSRWSFRLDYSYTRLRARDEVAAWRPEAKLSFQSKMHDIGLMAEFNFLNYYTGRPESSISPYIFAGVSGFMFNTRAFTGNQTIDTCRLLTRGTDYVMQKKGGSFVTEPATKNKYGLSIPFGVGCKLSLSKHLAATIEWRMHYALTDYLDDVSGVYAPNAKHSMLVAKPATDNQGNNAYVPAPFPLSEIFPNGIPLYDFEEFVGDPSHLPQDKILVYDFSDPSGLFDEKQQRGNHANNDWFGMINLSFTWKFVIPGNSACKMNIE